MTVSQLQSKLGSSSDSVLSLSLLVADGEAGLSDTSCSVMETLEGHGEAGLSDTICSVVETLEGHDVVATLPVVGTDNCPCKMSILMAGMPPLPMALSLLFEEEGWKLEEELEEECHGHPGLSCHSW